MSDQLNDTLVNNRLDEVLELLRERTSASITEIAERFQVSEMTTRRDLNRLVESGHVIRIPGGARIARSMIFEKSFGERLQKMAEAKNKIGRAAASLVREGEAVAMDSGTTTLCIARHLRSHKNIVVITFSLAVLDELSGCAPVRIELTGGVYRRASHDLIGNDVTERLSSISANKVFFGAAALSFQKGVMVFDPEAQRSLIHAGVERILVLDSSKIGAEALYGYCRIEDCDLVVTDSAVDPEALDQLRKTIPVLVAE